MADKRKRFYELFQPSKMYTAVRIGEITGTLIRAANGEVEESNKNFKNWVARYEVRRLGPKDVLFYK